MISNGSSQKTSNMVGFWVNICRKFTNMTSFLFFSFFSLAEKFTEVIVFELPMDDRETDL